MQPTKIETFDLVWNPITGCGRGCEYCYARRMAQRQKGRNGYPADEPFRATFHPDKLEDPLELKRSKGRRKRIFVCSMGDFLDEEVEPDWQNKVLRIIEQRPDHDFFILTKSSGSIGSMFSTMKYYGWDREFPKNLWMGASVTDDEDLGRISDLEYAPREVHRFVSFEPLHGQLSRAMLDLRLRRAGIEWAIVGAETGNSREKITPKCEWVRDICEAADRLEIPVFLKNNLRGIVGGPLNAPPRNEPLRHEFPEATP